MAAIFVRRLSKRRSASGIVCGCMYQIQAALNQTHLIGFARPDVVRVNSKRIQSFIYFLIQTQRPLNCTHNQLIY